LWHLLFSYDGRIGRVEYLICRFIIGMVEEFCLFLSLSYVAGGDAKPALWKWGVFLFLLLLRWPISAVAVKRGHDRNRPAWWTLTLEAASFTVAIAQWLSPHSVFRELFLNPLLLLLFMYWTADYLFLPTSPGAERYGPGKITGWKVGEARLSTQRPLLLNQIGDRNNFVDRLRPQTASPWRGQFPARRIWAGAGGGAFIGGGVMGVQGDNGAMRIVGDKLVISRKGTGFLSAVSVGLQSDKYINISDIAVVDLRPPGPLTIGYIRLSLKGKSPVGGLIEAMHDENAVTFSPYALRSFERFRDELILLVDAPTAELSTLPTADELEKLFSLKEKGVLNDEEFKTLKAKLIFR
jgi:uncharacterized membrane protein YhaH (DUF805 family)